MNEPLKEPLTGAESAALRSVNVGVWSISDVVVLANTVMRLRAELLSYYEIDRANDELMARGLHAVGDE